MQGLDWFDRAVLVHAISVAFLGWLAVFFGRTLVGGRMPLIERIARIHDPALSPTLARYTRRLTLVWTVYFVVAAACSIGVADVSAGASWWTGAAASLGAVVLFVGEHRLRPYLFPGKIFPGLRQQLRDTFSVWRGVA